MVSSVVCDPGPGLLSDILSWHNPLLLCFSHPSGPPIGRAISHEGLKNMLVSALLVLWFLLTLLRISA